MFSKNDFFPVQATRQQRSPFKEARAQKLGWKVLILKYDLGKSLNKEMWCKMADTKKIWLHIWKDEKCMSSEVNPFCVRGQENDFPS